MSGKSVHERGCSLRAVVVERYGGPEVLRLSDIARPRAGRGQVTVDIAAAGVNFIDVYHRAGTYVGSLPFVAGVEGAGVVAEVGPEVTGFAVGDRVGWVNIPGAYAERAAIPADRLVPLPAGLDPRTAASALLQGMTAHYLSHDTYPIQAGDTVLVHAAAGGMGLMLTRMVKMLGGIVIGTVSTEAKAVVAMAAGADHVLRYPVTDVAAAVREITDGVGVAAVYDGIGAPTFEVSLAAVRPRGTVAIYGQAGGPVPPVDVQRLNIAGSVFLTRPNLAHHIVESDELRMRASQVLDWIMAGELDARPGRTYPLAGASAAHTELESGRSTGKLVLTT
jgi:NADPH2:quinone reductase